MFREGRKRGVVVDRERDGVDEEREVTSLLPEIRCVGRWAGTEARQTAIAVDGG